VTYVPYGGLAGERPFRWCVEEPKLVSISLLNPMHVPEDILEFILRWRRKSTLYNYELLEDCFDGFFTAFVLYNFLYDLICEYNPNDYPQSGDRKRATEAVLSFLGSETIYNEMDLRRSASSIMDVVRDRTFYLRGNVWDEQKMSGLASDDSVTWAKALLKVLYQIRCHTFHGRKSFQSEQKRILVPSIRALEIINDLVIRKIAGSRFFEPQRLPDVPAEQQ
jgi:hypothetical protein